MTSPRFPLLLIRGLGHSGTTILDLALGAHPQIIGLGEAARILAMPKPGEEHRGPSQLRGSHRFERRCTCGAIAADCPLWGPQLEWLRDHDQAPLQEKVQRLLMASPHAGSGVWHVDSYQDDLEMTLLSDAMFDIGSFTSSGMCAPGCIPGPEPLASRNNVGPQPVSWRAGGE